MAKTFAQIATELKTRLDAYIADPGGQSEEEIQELIRELDWARDPGDRAGTAPPPRRQDGAAAAPGDNETSAAS